MSDRREVADGVNILVLEGGGARGLSSLLILDQTMDKLQHTLGLPNPPAIRDHFDIVAGTGTGAVIACMVGRLGVPVKKAIEYYIKLAGVFAERKRIGTTMYKTTKLQDVLKGIVKDATGDENTRMMDRSKGGDQSKTMVFAMAKHNMNVGTPHIFRSYQAIANQLPDCAIWEALAASMAHPEMFKPIEIGDAHMRESFVDGGLSCNNPVAHVLVEAKTLFPDRYLSTIVCIGAGHPSTIQIPESRSFARLIPNNILSVTKQIAADAEQVAQEMAARFRAMNDLYFRFSVDQGIQSVRVSEWEKLSEVTAHARPYMQGREINTRINKAVQAVQERKTIMKIERIDGATPLQTINPGIGVKTCPAPTPVFTGRQDKIDQIIACVSHGDIQRCVFVLYGLGGAGKTQLALKTVQQTKEMWTDVVFVDATSYETAVMTLSGFAKSRNISDSPESAITWLGNQRERWLMVIDNADDPAVDIKQYFPPGDTGSILVTTRIVQLAILAQGPSSSHDHDHEVSGMEPEEAMRLLMKTAKMKESEISDEDHEAAVLLLESFGYLALAIVQAGAYIFYSKRTISQYQDMFMTHQKATLEKYNQLLVKPSDYQRSVYTTWDMSYRLLGTTAQRLLHLMAFMHRSEIKEDIFRHAAINLQTYEPAIPETETDLAVRAYVVESLQPYIDSSGAWDSCKFLDAMAEILSYSLIRYNKINSIYTLHVLVHNWASTVVDCPIDRAIERTSLLLAASIDYEDTMQSLEYKRMIEMHVSTLLERQSQPNANNAARFGQVYARTGKWNQKEKMELIVVNANHQALGEEHSETLASVKELAYSYQQQGRFSEAVILQSHTLDISKRVSGENHSLTLDVMSDLAATYFDLGRHNDAESFQSELVDTRMRTEGKNHPKTLDAMSALAITYNAQGRYDEAKALLLQVVDASKRVSGDEHPTTLNAMHALAAVYYQKDQYEQAESLQVHVLEARKRRSGDEYPDTLTSMGDLASTYRAQGRYEEAEALQTHTLGAMKRVYGEDHLETLNTTVNLASTLWYQGRYEEAEQLEQRVIDGYKRVLGSRHPHTLLAMRNLLTTYKKMGAKRQQEHEALQEKIEKMET